MIGRVTTGNFSLRQGRGEAIGVIPLISFLRIWLAASVVMRNEQEKGEGRKVKGKTGGKGTKGELLVLFRNRDGEVFRAARMELL